MERAHSLRRTSRHNTWSSLHIITAELYLRRQSNVGKTKLYLHEVTVDNKYKEKAKSEKLFFSGKVSVPSCDSVQTQSELNVHLTLSVNYTEICLQK
jgi:hypothetical protein